MWFRLLRREVEFARDAELGLLPDPPERQPGNDDATTAVTPSATA